jgi:hypothetical protein
MSRRILASLLALTALTALLTPGLARPDAFVAWTEGDAPATATATTPRRLFEPGTASEAASSMRLDGFGARLDRANLVARRARSADEYIDGAYAASLRTPSGVRDAWLWEAAGLAERALRSDAELGRLLRAAPFRLVVSDGLEAEAGWAHTVGRTIVVPSSRRGRGARDLAALLVHEATHVFQRQFPAEAAAEAAAMGYDVASRGPSASGGFARANPDTDGLVYPFGGHRCESVWTGGEGAAQRAGLGGAEVRCVAGAGWAPATADAVPRGGRWSNPEHPWEVAAEAAQARALKALAG